MAPALRREIRGTASLAGALDASRKPTLMPSNPCPAAILARALPWPPRSRSRWSSWINDKQAAAWLQIPVSRFRWLARTGWLPAATTGPSDRQLWHPSDLWRAFADLPERYRAAG